MKKISVLFLLVFVGNALADEGMWQPQQLPSIAKDLQAAGLKLNPDSLTDLTGFPMGAIVSLGGCTASFVSDLGLIVTNHHCSYGSLQYNSSEENNILENGFLAMSLDKELPAAPGSRVYVTEEIKNVTSEILGGLKETTRGVDRYNYIEDLSKQLVAACESDDKYRCRVVDFHGGLEYYLFKQLTIRDVRLVHAPAKSIGKYGGDIDNWMWPRHTGDYSFIRAYVGKDGLPADYSVDNVPYHPKHHLKVSAKGVADGDYLMVIGYPGRTSRYRTAAEVAYTFNEGYPLSKDLMGGLISVILDNTSAGSAARIKYESLLAGLANYEKNRGSMSESYYKGTTQQRKDERDAELRAWVDKDSKRKAKYGTAIDNLDKLVAESQATGARDTITSFQSYYTILGTAEKLYRLALEKQKPNSARESGYQERDVASIMQAMNRMTRRYDPAVDQALLKYMLERYSTLPQDQHLASLDTFFGVSDGFSDARIDEALADMYARTLLGDEGVRLEWMDKSAAEFESSDDPCIQYAVATFAERKQIEDQSNELAGELSVARPMFMEAIIALNKSMGKPIYADANSTLRVTYGNVKGYMPADGMYAVPFTRLEGILEKDTGAEPFDAPKRELELIREQQYGKYLVKSLGSVPVNFLGTLDITGGNSGSPTLNDKAELVGLVFDGVYESIIGDWDYEPSLNRSISVDSRYMLWLMENLDGANNLINEMDIVR